MKIIITQEIVRSLPILQAKVGDTITFEGSGGSDTFAFFINDRHRIENRHGLLAKIIAKTKSASNKEAAAKILKKPLRR